MPIIIHGANTGGVNSFNGRKRDVLPQTGDYTPAMVGMEDGVLLESVTAAMPTSDNWYSVTYGNGLFVAVAESSNKAAYSTDGITWTQTTLPSTGYWRSVTFGNGTFVAIAHNSNVAAYSTDGITWTATSLPSSTNWRSVTYGNDTFVAIAYNVNKAAYSTDGITWNATTLPASDYWRSVTYGNGKFVAVIYSSSNNIAAYSIDGITWTQSTLPTSVRWSSVTYGNGTFVAIAWNANKAAYSTDGISWTISTLQNALTWESVTYGNDKFVAVASGSRIVNYSTDGINWTQSTMPTTADWKSVTYGNGTFVAVTYGSNIAAYSTDGITWFDSITRLSKPSGEDVTEQVREVIGGCRVFDVIIPSGWMHGDLDHDGLITKNDVEILRDCIRDPENVTLDENQLLAADVNGDGEVSVSDLAWLRGIQNGTKKYGIGGNDISGNWLVNENYETEEAQFYTDIEVGGVTENDKAVFFAPGVLDVVCGNGYVRVYVALCPISSEKGVLIVLKGLNGNVAIDTGCISDVERDSWNAKAEAPFMVTVDLQVSGWDTISMTQTVAVPGVLASQTEQIITPAPHTSSQSDYYESGIRCTGQDEDSLTFTAEEIPTSKIQVYVAIQNL